MYNKHLYVFDSTQRPIPMSIRLYQEDDFAALIDIQRECFPPPFPAELWWNDEQLHNHTKLFPEGAMCVEINGHLAGSITGLLVDFDPRNPNHSWAEITDNGYIRSHNPDGQTLYVVDISVRPTYRKLGIGKLLMQSMCELVVHRRLDRLLGGGRISGYHHHADVISADHYVNEVMAGKLIDPVITFLLRCGRTPVTLIENYLDDEESLHYALLMEWKNPFKNI